MATIVAVFKNLKAILRSYGIYALVALAVVGPLLVPGFVLTMDMVFTPRMPLPEQVTSSYPFYALLHVLAMILPSDLIQKCILLAIILLASIGMHRLLHFLQTSNGRQANWGIYAASVLFAVNPFTYSRLMAGQFAVLLGYALLPWFMKCLLGCLQTPSVKQGVKLGTITAVIGIVSIHTLGLVAVIAGVVGLLAMLDNRSKQVQLWPPIRASLIAAGICIAISSYWLIPLLLGNGDTAQAISRFNESDTDAFVVSGSTIIERLYHVLGLQGFWAEGYQLYLLPRNVMPLWTLALLSLWGILLYGGILAWRSQRTLAITLVLIGLIAIIVSVLPVINLASAVFPPLAGFREPHKFIGLLALVYSILFAYGATRLVERWKQAASTIGTLGMVAILILPVLLAPTMFWGGVGQLRASHYPEDWHTANKTLNRDTDQFNVVALPWHQYMSYGFAGRIIANPAPTFFEKPIIASEDPELKGAKALRQTASSQAVGRLVATSTKEQRLGSKLQRYNVKYVLLVKEYDYQKYTYLEKQQDLTAIYETETLTLYRNKAWRAR